ncbi:MULTISPECIES: type III secretion protein [Pseudomonas]|uniref:Type III secretion protein n=1 Tax=Pseudomonas lutea TaxID=243924 RepID=A0A9X8MD80_9PSED|nr:MULTISPECIES: type III secretion protein [Pseudomonas]SEQ63906.1 hypothetical protein SAMN05216409_107123 [Pseudomonas lutea]
MDDELEIDPQRAALEEVIRILAPLRQHRQAKAERLRLQAERDLQNSRDHLSELRSSFTAEQVQQREQRHALSVEHLNQRHTLNEVDRWHEQERSMLDHLSRLRQGIQLQIQAVEQQQETLEHAQDEARNAQRAVEKLSCLTETMHDEN